MKLDDNLNTIFELKTEELTSFEEPHVTSRRSLSTQHIPVLIDQKSESEETAIDTTDFNKVRSNLYNLLENGEDALLTSLEIAKQSEAPRSFEVFTQLLKTLADTNIQLLGIHEKKAAPVATSSVVQNNALFVGSTQELSEMLKKIQLTS